MKTVSLELAKQLKEAGYPQEGFHFNYISCYGGEPFLSPPYQDSHQIVYSSPMADEILDKLPNEIIGDDEGMRFDLNIYKGVADVWAVCYWWDEDSRRKSGMFIKNTTDKSLADAAAKQWLYLKKMELI